MRAPPGKRGGRIFFWCAVVAEIGTHGVDYVFDNYHIVVIMSLMREREKIFLHPCLFLDWPLHL